MSLRIERDRLPRAALAVAERLAGMVRDLPDTAVPIPGSEWTVGEAAAHLAYTNIGMAIMARGLFIPYADGTREGFRQANADSLEAYPERDGAVLAGRIALGVRAFLAEAGAAPPGRVLETPMGAMDIDTFCSYLLTHNLMHGCAMADGLGQPYPFEPEHAPLVWLFMRNAFPRILDEQAAEGLHATVELTVEGSFSAALVFGDGTVRIEDSPPGPVDCFVAADPLTFFLVIVGLVAVTDAVDRGGMKIWGPRAELGVLLPGLYELP